MTRFVKKSTSKTYWGESHFSDLYDYTNKYGSFTKQFTLIFVPVPNWMLPGKTQT